MIEQIKKSLENANKIPWRLDSFGAVVNNNNELLQWYDGEAVVAEKEDAHLIANAPEWLRYLIDEVERKDAMLFVANQQLEELQKALEWYADEEQYEPHGFHDGIPVLNDNGERARQARERSKA